MIIVKFIKLDDQDESLLSDPPIDPKKIPDADRRQASQLIAKNLKIYSSSNSAVTITFEDLPSNFFILTIHYVVKAPKAKIDNELVDKVLGEYTRSGISRICGMDFMWYYIALNDETLKLQQHYTLDSSFSNGRVDFAINKPRRWIVHITEIKHLRWEQEAAQTWPIILDPDMSQLDILTQSMPNSREITLLLQAEKSVHDYFRSIKTYASERRLDNESNHIDRIF
ncbi:2331_t:CDS:2 [Entrophospora sp. SA101]|nr:2331_t:CDS:2 [Entrophospora sp. SA101]